MQMQTCCWPPAMDFHAVAFGGGEMFRCLMDMAGAANQRRRACRSSSVQTADQAPDGRWTLLSISAAARSSVAGCRPGTEQPRGTGTACRERERRTTRRRRRERLAGKGCELPEMIGPVPSLTWSIEAHIVSPIMKSK